jgi:hypothetical protein
MMSAAMAPNNPSNDHSGMERDDMEEEHQEDEIAKELEPNDMVTG